MKSILKTLFTAIVAFCTSFYSVANDNFSFLSQLDYPVDGADVWGYANDGREYAIMGILNATVIIDVTDPNNIQEIFRVAGPPSFWRDIKTYDHYAYVVHDGTQNGQNDGLLIIDLDDLPHSISSYYWTGNEDINLKRAHNLFVDNNGFLHIIGSNHLKGGVIIADLKNQPLAPEVVGIYNERYVHDAFVRNNLLWTAEINDGIFSIVDITDKANPTVLGTKATDRNYTHNVWLSDNNRTLFTTDEKSAAPIGAYDVTNFNNIEELSQYRNQPLSAVIPHNVFVHGDFIVASMYKDGVIVADASDPENIIRVAHYDTAPTKQGSGFDGCWGVYPYLPSGNILASDISGGLFVLAANYNKACYLHGTITDANTNATINGAKIEIINSTGETSSNLEGGYKTGFAYSGLYSVQISKSGYDTKIIENVELVNGQITNLDVTLEGDPTGVLEQKNSFVVLNNPVGSHLKIKSANITSGSLDLSIFSISGEKVIHSSFYSNNNLILEDVSILPRGVYILELMQDGNPLFRTKIIKE